MRVRWFAVAAAVALVGAAGLARAASLSSIGVEVSIAGPQAAETSAWTELRVDLRNTGDDPATAHVTLTLPAGAARPTGAEGAQCSGSPVVECEQTLAGGRSEQLTVPVRWDGTGSRTVAVRARMEAGGSTAEASASSSVKVYKLVLTDLRTSPKPARAGRSFVAAALLARSDTGDALDARSLRCSAVIASTPSGAGLSALRGKGAIRGARLACSWRLPASAHGRYVRALMLADTHPGGMLTKYPFSRPVR